MNGKPGDNRHTNVIIDRAKQDYGDAIVELISQIQGLPADGLERHLTALLVEAGPKYGERVDAEKLSPACYG